MKKSPPFVAKYNIFPVFLPMQGCRGRCIYCDQYRISGAAQEDLASSQSQALDFLQRHRGESRQIAFYGGSFTALDVAVRESLIRPLLADLDENASFRISTHPLSIDAPILDWCKANRVQTIELGIQDFSDQVLQASQRGYGSAEAIKAVELVRASGFELGVQLMPGLPGWDEATLDYNHRLLQELKPDLLRLYPCLVLKDTPLHQLWLQGSFQPLSLDEALAQCADWQEICDSVGVKIIKLGLPSNLKNDEIAAGPWHPAFGELVKAELLVRSLQKSHPEGSIIRLDKKQWALIMAHGKYYYNILLRRIRNCSLEPL